LVGHLSSISSTEKSKTCNRILFGLAGLVATFSPLLPQRLSRRMTRDRCYDFKNIFGEKFGEKHRRFLLKLLLVVAQRLTITLFF
jgi:hypothetical protein